MIKRNILWKNLGIAQREEIKDIFKNHYPYLEFDFVGDRIFSKGQTGSSADFVELSVEGLFSFVIDILYSKNNKVRNLKKI
jgi:hypothetical protein